LGIDVFEHLDKLKFDVLKSILPNRAENLCGEVPHVKIKSHRKHVLMPSLAKQLEMYYYV